MTGFQFNQPLVLITRSNDGRDADGNRTRTDTAAVIGGIFAPGSSIESNNGQQRTIDQDSVFVPTGTDASAVDAVVVNPVLDGNGQPVLDGNGRVQGDWYDVDGDPNSWVHPNGWAPGVQVMLKQVSG